MEALNTNIIKHLLTYCQLERQCLFCFPSYWVLLDIIQTIGRTLILKASLNKTLDKKTHPSPQSETCRSTVQLPWFCVENLTGTVTYSKIPTVLLSLPEVVSYQCQSQVCTIFENTTVEEARRASARDAILPSTAENLTFCDYWHLALGGVKVLQENIVLKSSPGATRFECGLRGKGPHPVP